MAITKAEGNVNINTSKIYFICPVCKSKKSLEVPKSVIEEAKQLTTMSIARGLVCKHQFQAFVDKNFHVRGYQRVDFEIENKSNQEKSSNLSSFRQNDEELFENLILEGNYLEYKPTNTNSKKSEYQKSPSHQNKMTLEEIYNEFWEFIDENNEKFKDFIDKDSRRNQTLSIY